MGRQIAVEHGGNTLYGKVATIKRTTLGVEDHGILTATLHVQGDGWGVGVGGYSLDEPKRDEDGKFLGRVPTAYGFDHVVKIMTTVGVDSWEELVGREVIVLFSTPDGWGSQSIGIAHISDERRVLVFAEHAESWNV